MSCPICQNPIHKDYAPFCSKVCKNIDLIKWFREDYRIPTQEPVEDEGEEEVTDS
jgi:endogenous inhibitor of DNA gyrase (YacG/DUF329 family)